MSDDKSFSLSAPVVPEITAVTEYGYDLMWSDFRLRQADDDLPHVHVEHFASWEQANVRKCTVRDNDGIVACITKTPPPKAKSPPPRKFRRDLRMTR